MKSDLFWKCWIWMYFSLVRKYSMIVLLFIISYLVWKYVEWAYLISLVACFKKFNLICPTPTTHTIKYVASRANKAVSKKSVIAQQDIRLQSLLSFYFHLIKTYSFKCFVSIRDKKKTPHTMESRFECGSKYIAKQQLVNVFGEYVPVLIISTFFFFFIRNRPF